MLLLFFWDPNAPIAPPVIEVPEPTPSRGSGKNRREETYRPFDDEYWQEKAARTKQDAPKSVHFVEPTPFDAVRTPRQITENEMAIAALRQQLRQAPSVEVLKQIANQISQLKSLPR